jgi:hypothetical protein
LENCGEQPVQIQRDATSEPMPAKLGADEKDERAPSTVPNFDRSQKRASD